MALTLRGERGPKGMRSWEEKEGEGEGKRAGKRWYTAFCTPLRASMHKSDLPTCKWFCGGRSRLLLALSGQKVVAVRDISIADRSTVSQLETSAAVSESHK